MSALPSEADIRVGLQHVCFVPKSDVTPRQQESGDQWFGQRQAAEALSSGSIRDLAENGFVR
jgi:hypothetical protein